MTRVAHSGGHLRLRLRLVAYGFRREDSLLDRLLFRDGNLEEGSGGIQRCSGWVFGVLGEEARWGKRPFGSDMSLKEAAALRCGYGQNASLGNKQRREKDKRWLFGGELTVISSPSTCMPALR